MANYEDDETFILSYKKMYDLNITVSKEKWWGKKNIMTYKNHVKFLEYENEKYIDEMNELRRSTLKKGN